jgi:TPR repeat protein
LYEDGRVVPKDMSKAMELYTQAAAAGIPQAQQVLARLRGQ